MSLLDELKKWTHPYEDEDEDDFEEFEPAPRAAVPERRDRSERMDRTGSLYSAPVEPERRSNKVVNIRASTIVGMVGGGGVGLTLFSYIKSFQYDIALSIILLVAAMVIVVDQVTGKLRKELLK